MLLTKSCAPTEHGQFVGVIVEGCTGWGHWPPREFPLSLFCLLVHSYASSEESRILVLTELLEQKAHSPFYQEGVSNALLKMAELGLTRAAAVLLQSGANLNFEGQQHPEEGVGQAGLGRQETGRQVGLPVSHWGPVPTHV